MVSGSLVRSWSARQASSSDSAWNLIPAFVLTILIIPRRRAFGSCGFDAKHVRRQLSDRHVGQPERRADSSCPFANLDGVKTEKLLLPETEAGPRVSTGACLHQPVPPFQIVSYAARCRGHTFGTRTHGI